MWLTCCLTLRSRSLVLILLLALALVLTEAQNLPVYASEPGAKLALVIGNGNYETSAAVVPLPQCQKSARTVADVLRTQTFNVTLLLDQGLGPLNAAIFAFGKQLRDTVGASVVVYVCSEIASFENRPFLLPVTAQLTRPADVLTQGLLAKSMITLLSTGQIRASLVVLDSVASPQTPSLTGSLEAMADAAATQGIGMVAAISQPSDDMTPLSATLSKQLSGTNVPLATVMTELHDKLGPSVVVALGMPSHPIFLLGGPPSVPVIAPAVILTTPPPVAGARLLLTDADLSDADRRRVQVKLRLLGYYKGTADGVFGPGTRAAIGRFQLELRVPITGILTATEASQLSD